MPMEVVPALVPIIVKGIPAAWILFAALIIAGLVALVKSVMVEHVPVMLTTVFSPMVVEVVHLFVQIHVTLLVMGVDLVRIFAHHRKLVLAVSVLAQAVNNAEVLVVRLTKAVKAVHVFANHYVPA